MTDNPEDVDRYRYDAEIEHALSFLDAVGVERAHLCEASRGAGLGACMAVESPDRFETLVMTNSHTFGPPAGNFEHRTEHVTDEFCTANAYVASRPKARETAAVMADRGEVFEETKRTRIRETHEHIRDGVLTLPTLYAFGRNDVIVPLETAIAAFDLLGQENPNVRLHLFNDCGHLPYREYPAEFVRILVDFVDRWR